MKVLVVKDTEKDKAGKVLSLDDFRLRYNTIGTYGTTDTELIELLKEERLYYTIHGKGIGKYFKVILK